MLLKRKTSAETLKLQEKYGVPYLVFPSLENTGLVRHAFSTRLGGCSTGDLATMNLSSTRGDHPKNVKENFQRFGAAVGFDPKDLVLSLQTPTTNVRLVTEEDRGKGFTRPRDYKDVDGLITNVPGLVLATFYADCVPLYFVDPVHRAIGLSHSGWRGTVNRMGEVTLQRMKEAFGTRPSDVWTAIGPSICQDCYEVSEDVAEAFAKEFPDNEKEILKSKGSGKYLLDLWRANEIVFMEAGVPKEQIVTTNLCTCCNPKLLFSHRASHGKRGNLGAFLMIKEQG